MPYNTLPRKGYGRILVQKEEDIQKVKDIIKEMDDFEYDYLPDDMIAVFKTNDVKTVYTLNFDSLDLNELQIRCWEQNIPIMIIKGLIETDYGNYKEYLSCK